MSGTGQRGSIELGLGLRATLSRGRRLNEGSFTETRGRKGQCQQSEAGRRAGGCRANQTSPIEARHKLDSGETVTQR